ncbi:uncharacterized membrane protein (DUF485 family) [Kibdelosporangium banguiense]|uniref:Uncharacterized membrane protein (DUF485 family) n=1 Tax=Kibdelosporangium banguiense TaxID=1365924 RepID=A0ABS4TJX4_9PSEU|nr:DUF485 domain-containing protein [Kibdelosporangium banguiense]MBP2324161.1 uncharacterized membrane protein (DUF485 family) [Kibdelosporangium banguiense]
MTHWSGRTSSASFGRIDSAREKEGQEGLDFVRIQRSEEFTELRSGLRRFVFPVSLLFFLWYLGFVVLAAYGGEFMSRRLAGMINIGLVLGVLQFVSTVLITLAYRRFAKRRIDPKVAALREREGLS